MQIVETPSELDAVLDQLRRLGTDHRWLEAKRAAGGFPTDLWKSLGALANTGGGLILLGVDESSGFTVTGVGDAKRTADMLEQLCEQAEPALRAWITLIDHPHGTVVVAQVPAVEPIEMPCHFPAKGAVVDTAYHRGHDGDIKYTPTEIAHMLDAQQATDHSRRVAPAGASLNSALVAGFAAQFPDNEPDLSLAQFGAVVEGHPTLAGWLVLGDRPESLSPLARVSCVGAPRRGDPADSQQRGSHSEGVVGELLEKVLGWITKELGAVQVLRNGHLEDDLDYPTVALRELVGNALVHRSFRSADEATTISVQTSELIVITNPGGVHPGVDARRLGLSLMSSPRNYALVRLCENATTPSGKRIVESRASGIPRADKACKEAACLPPLFVIGPASFSAVCVRGSLDVSAADARWSHLDLDQDTRRLLAGITRIEELAVTDAGSILHDVRVDVVLAARILGTRILEHAAVSLGLLCRAGVLVEHAGFDQPCWRTVSPEVQVSPAAPSRNPTASRPGRMADNVHRILTQISEAPDGELARAELQLDISRTATTNALQSALQKELIEATTDNPHDPKRRYRLTANGKRQLRKTQLS